MRKIGIQFKYTPLVVEQKNYTTKIVNAYIVYDLVNWSNIPLRNFTLKNCLLSTTTIAKDNKEKYVYSVYGIAFNGRSSWSFGNDYA